MPDVNVNLQHPQDGRILFFARDRKDYGFLSNFFPSPFDLENCIWPTVEHFYQFMQCTDERYRVAIQNAPTARDAKIYARDWFRTYPEGVNGLSESARLDVMHKAVFAKFIQNPSLSRLLILTAPCELIEDSPHDRFWGVGADGQGANKLGIILMECRDHLLQLKK